MTNNIELIAESKEHADSLRVVMQDQAAETIESLCDALVAARAEIEGQEPVAWMTQAGKVIRAFASDDSTHDGALYGWKPLFAAAGASPQPARPSQARELSDESKSVVMNVEDLRQI